MPEWKSGADLDVEWHLSTPVGGGWAILDAKGLLVETVYDEVVGSRIIADHNKLLLAEVIAP